MVQPLLNQKQACPLAPVRFCLLSVAEASPYGHHGSKGTGSGTVWFHGAVSASTALRGRGTVTAPCPWAQAARAAQATARRARRVAGVVRVAAMLPDGKVGQGGGRVVAPPMPSQREN